MADTNYKLVVPEDRRHTDWTTEVILDRDDNGNPSKVVGTNSTSKLSASDIKKVEALGYKVEKVSQSEAEELAAATAAGGDVTGAAPVFGGSEAPNQPGAGDESDSGEKKK